MWHGRKPLLCRQSKELLEAAWMIILEFESFTSGTYCLCWKEVLYLVKDGYTAVQYTSLSKKPMYFTFNYKPYYKIPKYSWSCERFHSLSEVPCFLLKRPGRSSPLLHFKLSSNPWSQYMAAVLFFCIRDPGINIFLDL